MHSVKQAGSENRVCAILIDETKPRCCENDNTCGECEETAILVFLPLN
jgi:hypothetical protein